MVKETTPRENKSGAKPASPATEALRVGQLEAGRYYTCVLSGRKVLHTGVGNIKWYNPDLDEYREAEASNYQLIPLRPQ